ncbi:hypothetical protein EROM_101280 [Encephalitozoon romaleae SJ-2008]|uniref:Exocyst complex protein EXO70 n=1 Tax=Encephalitozoon romaleae (strain SJ-2008) TaxID=1178016 RepID=I6ZKV1_ENCRO|nr:hypothetical protein EROM_101280 [Encephalitozoon romaleae SJ-2008]AFN83943.1 hypothetical protein EROM_101280 [Encephalitozoon romaleae SJ-2008]
MGMPENPNILHKLKKCAEISREIETQANRLSSLVERLQLSVIDGFRPYINPKKNIGKLLSFYNSFILTKETIEKEKSKVIKVFGESEKRFLPRDLKMLLEKKVMESAQTLIDMSSVLKEYREVKIVGLEINSLNEFIEKTMDGISESFFGSLRRSGEYKPEFREFAAFLLSNGNRRRFMSKYTDTVYSTLGFDDIGTDIKILLERTTNLEKFLLGIIKMNNNILGKENSEVTNIGLLKMFIIGLKRAIADNLMKMEKEEDISNIPALIMLNDQLNYSGDKRIGVVEELFVFKDSIHKIICNSILRYFEDLDMMMEPNKHCGTEELCLKMKRALDAFYDHRNVSEVFVSKYGKDFELEASQDIFEKFSAKTVEKILFLAETLKGIPKSMYIINNIYIFRNYLKNIEGIPIEKMIEINLEDVLGVWKKEISKRKEEDITLFLDKNIESQGRYHLPKGLGEKLASDVEKTVNDALKNKKYKGDYGDLKNSISKLYQEPK